MNANDRVLAYIRTGVPYLIGAFLAWLLATTGLDLNGDFQLALVTFTVAAVTNLYYVAIRLIEQRFPGAGVFLGWVKVPDYIAVDNLWASLVRTGIPTVVSALVVTFGAPVAATLFGFHLDAETGAGAIVIAVGIVEALYYTAAKEITTRFPRSSWLLGTSVQPAYVAKHAA